MIGMKFIVSASNCDEISEHTDPENMTMDIAARKAEMAHHSEGDIVIGADTVVVCDGYILGKPRDAEQAKSMLKKLSGKTHSVYTGVCILKDGKRECFCDRTDVKFYDLNEMVINRYIATGEPLDKAGAYGIQGRGSLLVEKIDGDFYNVVGLPVARVYKKLRELMGDEKMPGCGVRSL